MLLLLLLPAHRCCCCLSTGWQAVHHSQVGHLGQQLGYDHQQQQWRRCWRQQQ